MLYVASEILKPVLDVIVTGASILEGGVEWGGMEWGEEMRRHVSSACRKNHARGNEGS
jgi:hypothetical protein